MIFNPDALTELYETAADKINEKMRKVRNDVKSYERSWIWELIQNAKDNVASEFAAQKVSILIKLKNDEFIFSHNYGYFTRTNVEGIIRQVNKKDIKNDSSEDNNNIIIGRFGTGFMTTHLLSPVISVKALFEQNGKFNKFVQFTLDRTDIEKPALVKSITNSFEKAVESVNNAQEFDKNEINFSDYNSVFSYKLDDNAHFFARKGIDDLRSSLPFTLVFVNGINTVQINENDQSIRYIKGNPEPLEDNIFKVNILISENGVQKIRQFIYLVDKVSRTYKNRLVEVEARIAIEIETVGHSTKVSKFEDGLPHIFLDFPLIGTETFDFPAIINFPLFEPTEPRDSVYLEEQGKESLDNQEVFIKGKDLLIKLLQIAVKNEWIDIFNLAKSKLPSERKGLSRDWFKNNIQSPYRSFLLENPIMETEIGRINLKDAKIPYNSSSTKLEQIWDLTVILHKSNIPKREHCKEWNKIIDTTWSVDLRYDLKKLVQEISQLSNLLNLSQRINLTENETLEWLDKVIDFVVSEEDKLLNDFRIIPNQNGTFLLKDEIWLDNNIPSALKIALKKLQIDWFNRLQHTRITNFKPQIVKNTDDIIVEINRLIKNNLVVNEYMEDAVFYLLSCFPDDIQEKEVRKKVYQFANDYYKNIPETQNLPTWTSDIWEESDKWFIRNLCSNIATYQNLANLKTHLNLDSLQWIDNLIIFISKYRYEVQLNEFAILPNQKGNFKKKKELFVDDEIDEKLKDILEGLGVDCRTELLDKAIMLEIDDREQSSKDIAIKISDKVMQIFRIGSRDELTKQVFSSLYQWLFKNPVLAADLFSEIYDKRNLILRTDEENIYDIEFKQKLLANANGYTEDEILKLVNTPRENLNILSNKELEDILQKRIQEEKIKNSVPLNPDDTILSLGITSAEDLETARIKYQGTKIGEALTHISSNDYDKFAYVHAIIERAKRNVKAYLSKQSQYNINYWQEDSKTVIVGVLKDDKRINIVIRPADGGQIIIFYANEFAKLEEPNTELWYDNDVEQGLYSFGRLLRRANINRIPL
jgi:hypothetical protein